MAIQLNELVKRKWYNLKRHYTITASSGHELYMFADESPDKQKMADRASELLKLNKTEGLTTSEYKELIKLIKEFVLTYKEYKSFR